ncbi:MAG: HIT domain-containing protein [Nitrososphaerota archaeon]
MERPIISSRVDPKDCIFCRIVKRELPAYIVYEDTKYIAFLDKAPFSEGHTLVCPKEHGETIWDMNEQDIGGLFMIASRLSKAIVDAMQADGFRFVQNNGEAANQVVAHVHVHVVPVKKDDKGKMMGRIKISEDKMKDIADKITTKINNMNRISFRSLKNLEYPI